MPLWVNKGYKYIGKYGGAWNIVERVIHNRYTNNARIGFKSLSARLLARNFLKVGPDCFGIKNELYEP